MFYLINGAENFLINKEIEKICNGENYLVNYSLKDTLISDILEDASMISMFSDKKIIIIDNSEIFETGENNLEHNLDDFLNYINNPNPDTTLIFISHLEKLDERKKVTKKIKEIAVSKTFNKEKNISKIVSGMLEDYEISSSDLKFLINRTGNDLNLLEKEIEKLTSYKTKEKEIKKEDIELLVHKNIDLDIFSLLDNIILKKKEYALEQYYEMTKRNEEPIKITIMIAGQIRLMYQTLELNKKGYTEQNMASSLNVHPYRVKLALQKAHNYSSEKLLELLSSLGDLDEKIKTGKIDKKIGLEMFILTI